MINRDELSAVGPRGLCGSRVTAPNFKEGEEEHHCMAKTNRRLYLDHALLRERAGSEARTMKNDYKISRAPRDTAGRYTCANCLGMIAPPGRLGRRHVPRQHARSREQDRRYDRALLPLRPERPSLSTIR
jgi:hypothetical protein